MNIKCNERDFKGIWIPKEIWLDNNLTIMEKTFLVEIDSLDNVEGCFASNTYFSDFFGLSKQRCSQIINSLVAKNYIKCRLDRQGKEVVRRTLNVLKKLNTYQENFNKVSNKVDEGIKKSSTRCQENAKDNNTVNNISNKLKNKEIKYPSFEEIKNYAVDKRMSIDCKYFYEYFTESNWIDSNGKKVLNWKQKMLTWNSYNKKNEKKDYKDKTSIPELVNG